MWVCFGWYCAAVGMYLLIAYAQPDPPPDPECQAFGCGISARDVMLFGGAALTPVLLLCLVVSTVILTRRARRGGTPFRLGTLSAFAGLAIGFGAACVVFAAKVWL
jgi:hypothetical protein